MYDDGGGHGGSGGVSGGGDGGFLGRGERTVQLGFRRGEEHNERNVLPLDPREPHRAYLAAPSSYICAGTKSSLRDTDSRRRICLEPKVIATTWNFQVQSRLTRRGTHDIILSPSSCA